MSSPVIPAAAVVREDSPTFISKASAAGTYVVDSDEEMPVAASSPRPRKTEPVSRSSTHRSLTTNTICPACQSDLVLSINQERMVTHVACLLPTIPVPPNMSLARVSAPVRLNLPDTLYLTQDGQILVSSEKELLSLLRLLFKPTAEYNGLFPDTRSYKLRSNVFGRASSASTPASDRIDAVKHHIRTHPVEQYYQSTGQDVDPGDFITPVAPSGITSFSHETPAPPQSSSYPRYTSVVSPTRVKAEASTSALSSVVPGDSASNVESVASEFRSVTQTQKTNELMALIASIVLKTKPSEGPKSSTFISKVIESMNRNSNSVNLDKVFPPGKDDYSSIFNKVARAHSQPALLDFKSKRHHQCEVFHLCPLNESLTHLSSRPELSPSMRASLQSLVLTYVTEYIPHNRHPGSYLDLFSRVTDENARHQLRTLIIE
jgi:hypothetical protein